MFCYITESEREVDISVWNQSGGIPLFLVGEQATTFQYYSKKYLVNTDTCNDCSGYLSSLHLIIPGEEGDRYLLEGYPNLKIIHYYIGQNAQNQN